MDAAVPADAQNAPTGTWKTAQRAVSHSAHTQDWFEGEERTEPTTSTRPTHEIPDTSLSLGPVRKNPSLAKRRVACRREIVEENGAAGGPGSLLSWPALSDTRTTRISRGDLFNVASRAPASEFAAASTLLSFGPDPPPRVHRYFSDVRWSFLRRNSASECCSLTTRYQRRMASSTSRSAQSRS